MGKKIGEGACAVVFEANEFNGKDKIDNKYVIKCIPLPTGKGKNAQQQTKIVNTLYYEHVLYRGVLLGFKYAPKLPSNAYGEDSGYRYLVMQRLDIDLKTYAQNRIPSVSSIGLIGFNIIDGLRILHNKGHVFVDIKPDNFMILKSSADRDQDFTKEDKLFFVDFGLVEKYTQYAGGGSHRPVANRDGVAGTPAFVSLSVHDGSQPCRKDDIEALGYMLLSLRMGAVLPWSTATSEASCRASKLSCDISHLAQELGLPEIGDLILYARGLSFDQQPDYDLCSGYLTSLQSRKEPMRAAGNKRGANSLVEEERQASVDLTAEDSIDPRSPHRVAKGSSGSRGKAKKQKAVTEPFASLLPAEQTVLKPTAAPVELEAPQPSHKPTPRATTTRSYSGSNPVEESVSDPFAATLGGPFGGGEVRFSPRRSPRLSAGSSQGLSVEVVLEAIAGPHSGQLFAVGVAASKPLSLGRHSSCSLVLHSDDYLSENHMAVRVAVSSSGLLSLEVKDSGSTNGTLVCGEMLPKKRWTPVNIGELIEAGRSILKVSVRAV